MLVALAVLGCGGEADSERPAVPAPPVARPPIALVSGGLDELIAELGLAARVVDGAAPLALGLATSDAGPRAAALRAAGADVHLFDPRSANDVTRTIRAIGALAGVETRAQAVVARLQGDVAAVAGARDGQHRVRVAWLLDGDPLAAVGGSGLLHEMLELAGAENAFHLEGETRVATDAAAVAALAPEVVLVGAQRAGAVFGAARVIAAPAELSRLPTLDLVARVRALHALFYPPDAPAARQPAPSSRS